MNERILVVDDTPMNIQAVAEILRGQGFRLSVAPDGTQALRVLESVRPDLVLLDVVMPGIDGFETCRRIKLSENLREIPIIFLTSKTEPTDIVQGFEAGAVDYVAKPFNAHELIARVQTHLTLDQLRRSLKDQNIKLERAHELVRRVLGRYVSEEVAQSLLCSPEALELGGEEREITILMSDLRGFTAMAARNGPREVIEVLNLYLDSMVEVIGRHKGTIDEIIGDAILVMFGAPIASEDHATRAVACALEMQLAMDDVNRRLVTRGAAALEMGIGIHTGPVIVGNIGSARRTKYAAVGSNVNLAGRIESFTTGGQILISEKTRERLAPPLRIDAEFDVEPKGATEKLRLYAVGGLGAPYELYLPAHDGDLRQLPRPLAAGFTILEEKMVGRTVHEGVLTAVSKQHAVLQSATPLPKLANVRITVTANDHNPGGEIYAKVVGTVDNPPGIRLRFTSVTPELERWFREFCET